MLKRGDIVLLPYPFTDLSDTKARPAIVVSTDKFNNSNNDAVFLCISRTDYKTPFDFRIDSHNPSFLSTGLKYPSTFRTAKIVTLEKKLAKKRLGRADSKILSEIELRLKSLLEIFC